MKNKHSLLPHLPLLTASAFETLGLKLCPKAEQASSLPTLRVVHVNLDSKSEDKDTQTFLQHRKQQESKVYIDMYFKDSGYSHL